MAAKKLEKFTIEIDLKGLEDLTGLTRSLKQLKKAFDPLSKEGLKSLNSNIAKTIALVPKSINQFKQKERTLKALRNQTDLTSKEFKDLGRAIDENAKKLKSFTQVQPKGFFGKLKASKFGVGGRAALGAMAGSQASKLGSTGSMALAGAALGGPAGALAGAGIGAVLDLGGAAGAAAKYSAQIQKLEVALKGVTKTQGEFAKAQKIITDTSRRLNVPLGDATKQFTTLSASVIGSGGNVEDAEKVFKGVSEAIKATGGDAEDVQSAIRAMSQIFGKGKVSAEELQGQLGERLPGAVVKFATATGRTLPELQKDLRDGTVGLNDVMKFVVKLSEDHAEAAEKMANSQADAGQKMGVALRELQKEFGDLFVPVGAMIQGFVTQIARATTAILKFFKFVIKGNKEVSNELQARDFALEQVGGTSAMTKQGRRRFAKTGVFDASMLQADKRDQFNFIQGQRADFLNQQDTDASTPSNFDDPVSQEKLNEKLAKRQLQLGLITKEKFDQLAIDREAQLIFDEMSEIQGENFKLTLDEIKQKLKENKNETYNFKEELKKVAESAMDLKSQIGELAVNAVNKLADGFVELAMTGKASFADLARSILADLQRMILKALFFKALFGLFPGLQSFLGFEKGGVVESAKGNVFAENKVVPYKSGGVIDRPVIFPMAKGMGLAGEAGPEAILPLKRGRGGRLGVESSGGVGNVVVNVDASGSSVEGDNAQASELGKMLGAVVQAELVKQKRPGGLLA
ncbi:tape measure protein [Hyphomonas sp.]|uniref:tape measure protein n=1 Tax=Hyphomonas sp. TaxID=87 RepID=UPI000C8F2CAD|nr:tape measure protein [Hyphomonas sp.]MAL46836.1 hypothetical protein [Hyphomonas sp.]